RRRSCVGYADGAARSEGVRSEGARRGHREAPLVLRMHGRDTHVAHGVTVSAEIDLLTLILDLDAAGATTRRDLGRWRIRYGPGIPDLQLLGASVVRVTDDNQFVQAHRGALVGAVAGIVPHDQDRMTRFDLLRDGIPLETLWVFAPVEGESVLM